MRPRASPAAITASATPPPRSRRCSWTCSWRRTARPRGRSLFVDLFLEAHRSPPRQIILDLDATDVPLHGHQEGRFFHGRYDAYCCLPLYIFCGRHLLAAKLRRANIDASAGAVDEVARIVGQIG